jgi:para-nitrobenzyl esterase
MKKDILVTISQGTLRGTEEESMMTFYRIPYGTNAGRYHEVGAAPVWEGTRDAMQKTGSKVYLYSFAWQSPKELLGAPHCIDLPFVFGNLGDWADSPMLEGADTEKLRQLSERLQGAVLRFMKNGNPSSEEELWPEYCGDEEMMVIE